MMTRTMMLMLALLVLVSGCGKKSATTTTEARTRGGGGPPPASASATPAAPDMCAEHGVLEAICTQCNPKLIAVFRANGDYCEEHGLPMSVCPVHHPERGGRPAADVAIDEAPADGTKIRFKSLETARRSGLEFASAVAGSEGSGLGVPALIVADPSRVARVNAPARGVVRQILVRPGVAVRRGASLAVIASAEVGAARSNLQAAAARARAAEAGYHREKGLHERGISALREVQEAQREWETARAEVEAASAALSMMGASGGSAGSYVLRAPIGGTVVSCPAGVGSAVDLETPLFEIIDASTLWAEMDVPERDAARVAKGQRIVLRVDGLPGREFHGTIESIAPVIDPRTRSAKARARITTRDLALKANMFARATVFPGASKQVVLVPRAALQEAKGAQLVFVRLSESEFETRRVEATPAEGEMVAVASGLKPGEPVVTTGSFLLKTETLKGSIGTGCCEVDPPKR